MLELVGTKESFVWFYSPWTPIHYIERGTFLSVIIIMCKKSMDIIKTYIDRV